MSCEDELMQAERELTETRERLAQAQGDLATTRTVLGVVLQELTPEQFGRARLSLEAMDLSRVLPD